MQTYTADHDAFRRGKHTALCSGYDEFVSSLNQESMITRAATRGEPTSVYVSVNAYDNSFLQKPSEI